MGKRINAASSEPVPRFWPRAVGVGARWRLDACPAHVRARCRLPRPLPLHRPAPGPAPRRSRSRGRRAQPGRGAPRVEPARTGAHRFWVPADPRRHGTGRPAAAPSRAASPPAAAGRRAPAPRPRPSPPPRPRTGRARRPSLRAQRGPRQGTGGPGPGRARSPSRAPAARLSQTGPHRPLPAPPLSAANRASRRPVASRRAALRSPAAGMAAPPPSPAAPDPEAPGGEPGRGGGRLRPCRFPVLGSAPRRRRGAPPSVAPGAELSWAGRRGWGRGGLPPGVAGRLASGRRVRARGAAPRPPVEARSAGGAAAAPASPCGRASPRLAGTGPCAVLLLSPARRSFYIYFFYLIILVH